MVQMFSPEQTIGTVLLLHGYLDHVGILKKFHTTFQSPSIPGYQLRFARSWSVGRRKCCFEIKFDHKDPTNQHFTTNKKNPFWEKRK